MAENEKVEQSVSSAPKADKAKKDKKSEKVQARRLCPHRPLVPGTEDRVEEGRLAHRQADRQQHPDRDRLRGVRRCFHLDVRRGGWRPDSGPDPPRGRLKGETDMADNANWYVVHTYSGYENTVKATIEKYVENRHLQDVIHEISIPLETVTEITDNGPKEVERKVFPGYVLVKMVMNDETWHVVRNIRGVTGFLGEGEQAHSPV